MPRSARSAALLLRQIRPSSRNRVSAGSVGKVLQIGLRPSGHGRLAVFDVATPDQEPRHDQDRE
jgi:hypothetical protein